MAISVLGGAWNSSSEKPEKECCPSTVVHEGEVTSSGDARASTPFSPPARGEIVVAAKIRSICPARSCMHANASKSVCDFTVP